MKELQKGNQQLPVWGSQPDKRDQERDQNRSITNCPLVCLLVGFGVFLCGEEVLFLFILSNRRYWDHTPKWLSSMNVGRKQVCPWSFHLLARKSVTAFNKKSVLKNMDVNLILHCLMQQCQLFPLCKLFTIFTAFVPLCLIIYCDSLWYYKVLVLCLGLRWSHHCPVFLRNDCQTLLRDLSTAPVLTALYVRSKSSLSNINPSTLHCTPSRANITCTVKLLWTCLYDLNIKAAVDVKY